MELLIDWHETDISSPDERQTSDGIAMKDGIKQWVDITKHSNQK